MGSRRWWLLKTESGIAHVIAVAEVKMERMALVLLVLIDAISSQIQLLNMPGVLTGLSAGRYQGPTMTAGGAASDEARYSHGIPPFF